MIWKKIKQKFLNFTLFLLSLLAKFLVIFRNLFGYIIGKILFSSKYANLYFKNFYSELVIIRKLRFQDIYIDVKINSFWDYWRIFEFEKYSVEELFSDISENRNNKPVIYYEIGANVGYSALLIAKKIEDKGHVYAVEAEPTNYKTLCDNIILNKLKNITPINIGINNNSKVGRLYYNQYHTKMHKTLPVSGMGAHSIVLNDDLHNKKIFAELLFTNFDDLIKNFNLKIPTHIYVDAHGSETSVIESMKFSLANSNLEKILIDIEEDDVLNIEKTKIYEILLKEGFKLKKNDFIKSQSVVGNSHKAVFVKPTVKN